MELTFLGTGAAWGLPELNCNCLVCREMRGKGEKRERTALLLSNETTLLVDCGPDIRSQLSRNRVPGLDAVLISHEHGDHYLGLDDLAAYKRNAPRDRFKAIPVYLSPESWKTIRVIFGYLEATGVLKINEVAPGSWFEAGEFEILPFATDHGSFAEGSVGFVIRFRDRAGDQARLVYTSDFKDLPAMPEDILAPDYLIIQSFWLHEPVHNRPNHMSFQRAVGFIERLAPKKETFVVHVGDGDKVAGDPANVHAKKYDPRDPLRPPSGGDPYPIPLNQDQWQNTVDRIMSDRGLPYKVTVARDGLKVPL